MCVCVCVCVVCVCVCFVCGQLLCVCFMRVVCVLSVFCVCFMCVVCVLCVCVVEVCVHASPRAKGAAGTDETQGVGGCCEAAHEASAAGRGACGGYIAQGKQQASPWSTPRGGSVKRCHCTCPAQQLMPQAYTRDMHTTDAQEHMQQRTHIRTCACNETTSVCIENSNLSHWIRSPRVQGHVQSVVHGIPVHKKCCGWSLRQTSLV